MLREVEKPENMQRKSLQKGKWTSEWVKYGFYWPKREVEASAVEKRGDSSE